MESQSSLRRVTRRYNASSGKSPISISQNEHDSDNETEFLSSTYFEDGFANSRVITSSITQRESKSRINNTSDYSSEEIEDSFDKRHRNGKVAHSADLSNHKPYKLYKEAGEYWNKYPKTDYTYSRYSPHRRELEPGVIVMPNMSRRSIHREDNSTESYKSNYRFEETPIPRNYYGNSDMLKRRLEQFCGTDEVDYHIQETFIQKILRITRITLIFSVISNYFYSFTIRGSHLSSRRYTTYIRDERWYHKIWNVITSGFAKIGSAYYTLLGGVMLLDSWLLRRENRTKSLSEESSQNNANQISEQRWKVLRKFGYALLVLALILLGINYGTNKELHEYIKELPTELPELSLPPISIPKPISDFTQSSQDAVMESFEYTKLATSELYNDLYNFFLSEYLSLNQTESAAVEPIIETDTIRVEPEQIVQPQEDELYDNIMHDVLEENIDPLDEL